MEQGLLHLHNVLRWVVLIFLLITMVQVFTKNEAAKKLSLFLLISAHTMLLIGLYQLFWGRMGILKTDLPDGVSVMKNSYIRFFWVEHPLMMFLGIVLITVARGRIKAGNYKPAGWMLLIALLIILAAVPWPFREAVARPLFPGM